MSSNSDRRFPDDPLAPAGIALYSFLAFALFGGAFFFLFRLMLPFWRGGSAFYLFSPAMLVQEAGERAQGIPVTGWGFLRATPWVGITALLVILLLYWGGPLLFLRGLEGLRRRRTGEGADGSPLRIGLPLSTGIALLLFAFLVPVLTVPLQYRSYRRTTERAAAAVDRQLLLPDLRVMALNAQAWYARNPGGWMDSAGTALIDTAEIRSAPGIAGPQLMPHGDPLVNRYLVVVSKPAVLSIYGLRADPAVQFTRSSLLKACTDRYQPVEAVVTPEHITITSYG